METPKSVDIIVTSEDHHPHMVVEEEDTAPEAESTEDPETEVADPEKDTLEISTEEIVIALTPEIDITVAEAVDTDQDQENTDTEADPDEQMIEIQSQLELASPLLLSCSFSALASSLCLRA